MIGVIGQARGLKTGFYGNNTDIFQRPYMNQGYELSILNANEILLEPHTHNPSTGFYNLNPEEWTKFYCSENSQECTGIAGQYVGKKLQISSRGFFLDENYSSPVSYSYASRPLSKPTRFMSRWESPRVDGFYSYDSAYYQISSFETEGARAASQSAQNACLMYYNENKCKNAYTKSSNFYGTGSIIYQNIPCQAQCYTYRGNACTYYYVQCGVAAEIKVN
jgi:hypothetical protein